MGKLAFVFPGQGSQSVGMLADLAAESASVEATFSRASEVLGYDLWQLVQAGPEEQLNQTEFTQPALLSASVACYRAAVAAGMPKPEVVAGHSLGEYSALVAAGVLQFEDAVDLVRQRGQFMQTAVPLGQGGMAAILGLDDDQVKSICDASSDDSSQVQAANFNAPGQVVIAGGNEALERAIDACKEAGARRAMPLAVSAPFHSAMMAPAAEEMEAALAGVNFNQPEIAVIQNVDADYEQDADKIRTNLVRQMCGAVLWTDTVARMAADGVDRVVECGPGKVLSGLNKRINRDLTSLALGSAADLASASEALGE